MNSKYQSGEKIDINKIFFEDSFIDLINKLSKLILEYYHQSNSLISKASIYFPSFDNNINQIILLNKKNNNIFYENNQELTKLINNINVIKKDFKSLIIKSEENLKNFWENAKVIFKEMKEKKNNRLDEIYNDYAHKNSPNKTAQKEEFNTATVEPFRLSNLSKESNNTKNQIKERNRTINKTCNLNSKNNFLIDVTTIKNLVNQMSNYNNIISTYSKKAKDNYIDLQNQLLHEINKSLFNNSKSVERKKIAKPNIIPIYNTNNPNSNNINNNNPFIMVNNNSNNVTLTTTNNNSYYNIIDKENLKDLKHNNSNGNSKLDNYINNNNDLKKEINILKLQLEESQKKNKELEKKLEQSNINLEMFKNIEKNKYNKYKIDLEIKLQSYENQNKELKKKFALLLKKESKDNDKKNENLENFDENNLDINNEIKKLKEEFENKKNEYELNIKKLNEEMNNERIENDKKLKKLNDDNTSLSKYLADKNREIQLLQNSNKLKINELNKLKLIVKNNEKQLRVKKMKSEQKKANSPNNIQIKDILKSNSRNNYDNNDSNNNSPNISAHNDSNKDNKEIISKLESEIVQLKEEIIRKDEEKESLTTNISILEKDINEKINENEILENELNNKNSKLEDENKIIGELKSEKDKLLIKLKEYKGIEELNLSQIKILKNHIKEIERQQNTDTENTDSKSIKKKELKKRINDLEIENANIKMQLNYELKFNCQLNSEVKAKTSEIEGLKTFINKLIAEKESYTLNRNTIHSENKDNDNSNILSRSKTNEELKFNIINKTSNKEANIKDIMKNENNLKNFKDKNNKKLNDIYQKENKTDKKLKTYNFNENDSSKKQNEGTKSEDAKIEFMNNNKNK